MTGHAAEGGDVAFVENAVRANAAEMIDDDRRFRIAVAQAFEFGKRVGIDQATDPQIVPGRCANIA